ncbi:hypothetical protein H5410_029320 [Solanum commersonii]|uniref:Uncharacterized protein n=1 Tax=Solanum commersonii TaxID=4109 RepID=A0A9J5Z8N6_SOLCO|nr:hypothetical protein H5410_029320 [Solanum commersonii]
MIVGRAVTKRSLWFVRWISVSSVELNGKQRFAALWGNGDHGRLGHGSLESQWRPNVLPSSAFDNQNLREIACGGAHSLFLTDVNHLGMMLAVDSDHKSGGVKLCLEMYKQH